MDIIWSNKNEVTIKILSVDQILVGKCTDKYWIMENFEKLNELKAQFFNKKYRKPKKLVEHLKNKLITVR